MLRNKTAKIVISILASFVVAFSANTVLADVGFKVGGSSLNLGASENLIYGLTGSSGSDSTSNFLLFEKGAGNSIFKINYGGNIGIGNSNPQYKLDVNGDINFSGALRVNGNVYPASQWSDASTGIYYNSGHVGIGTTNPGTRLHVETNQGAVAFFNSKLNGGNYAGYIGNGQTSSGEEFGLYYALDDSRLAVYDFANSKFLYGDGLIIDNNTNNVGIGADPAYRLDAVTTSSDAYYRFQAGSATQNVGTVLGRNGLNQWYMYSPANTTDFRISGLAVTDPFTIKDTTGYVGIGTTNPGARLEIRNNAQANYPSLKFDVNQYSGVIQTEYNGGSYAYLNLSPASGEVRVYRNGIDSFLSGYNAGGTRTFLFSTNGNSYITSGNVGIGTPTPTTATLVIGNSSTNYSIDAGNYRIGNVATPVSNLDAVNKSYVDSINSPSGPSTSTAGYWTGNGANGIYNNNSGNVGIGTTNPLRKLDIMSTSSSQMRLSYDSSNYVDVQSSSNGSLFFYPKGGRTYFAGVGANNEFYAYDYSVTAPYPYLSLSAHSLVLNMPANSGARAVRLTDNGSSYLTGGNVGIGTTSPFTKLQVFGGAAFGNGIQTSFLSGADFQIQKNNGNNTVLGMWQYGVASSLIGSKANDSNFYLTNNYYGLGIGTASTSIAITKTGNAGIGYASPGYRLDTNTASGDAYNRFMASSATQNVGTVLGRNGLNQWYMYSPANTTDFRISGLAVTDPFTIKDTTGYVGVGLTNPAAKLDVYGSARIGQSANSMGKTLTIAGNLTFDPVSNTTNAQVQGMGLANGGAGSIEAGTYYYAVVFSTAEGDTGVAGLTFSGFPSITFASPSQVNITNIPTSTDPRVTSRKIYRSQAGTVGDYYYLYNIGTIANNTATTYTDNSARNTTSNDWMYNKNNTTAGIIYRGSTVFGRLGDYVTAFGNAAMGSLTRGSTGAAFGSYALSSLTTGDANQAFGHSAGASVTSGANNNYFGYAAGLSNQTGSWNVAMGYSALRNNYNYSASYNIGIGGNALGELATGNNYNTGLGHYAGANSQATGGTYVGSFAGYQAATTTVGNYNTILGYSSGRTLGSGASNVIIGNSVELSAPNTSNQLNIGNVIYATGLTSGSTPSASGKMGIGTTTPTTATLVIGTSSTNYSIDAGNYRIGNVATPISNLDAANKSYVDSVSNPVGASTSTAGYWTGNGSNGIYNNNSGNVGVGTTAAGAKLHLVTTSGGQFPFIAEITGTGANKFVVYPWTDGNTYLQHNGKVIFAPLSSVTGQLTIDTNGNVGIGVTAPGYVLDTNTASGDAYNRFMASGATQNVGIALGRNGLNQWYMYSPANTTDFRISGLAVTDPFTIKDTTGYVGIGTTAPTQKLDVSGSIRSTNSSTFAGVTINGVSGMSLSSDNRGKYAFGTLTANGAYPLSLYSGRAGDFNDGYINLFTAGLERMRIDATGNVGIGTTAPTTAQLVIGTSSTNYTLDAGNYRIGNVAAPVSNLDAVNKTYVDSIISSSSGSGIFTSNINLNNNNILNVNKLTVNTIDPLYNIGGINYSSFAASVVGGVKEEYSGRAKLNNKVRSASGEREYEKVLDFDRMEKGSDLWVWRQVVDFSSDNIEVVATPSGARASIYYIIEGNHLIFRADRPVDISYRLTGRRFDWRNWPTRALDQTEKAGFIIQ